LRYERLPAQLQLDYKRDRDPCSPRLGESTDHSAADLAIRTMPTQPSSKNKLTCWSYSSLKSFEGEYFLGPVPAVAGFYALISAKPTQNKSSFKKKFPLSLLRYRSDADELGSTSTTEPYSSWGPSLQARPEFGLVGLRISDPGNPANCVTNTRSGGD
jgi:hypothetical protein